MATAYTLWPWVGDARPGNDADPLRVEFVPMSLIGKARLLRSGLTCFQRDLAGGIDKQRPVVRAAFGMLNSAVEVGRTDSHVLYRIDVPVVPAVTAALNDLHGFALWDWTLRALHDRAEAALVDAVAAIRAVRPDFDPTPAKLIAEAVRVIDRVTDDLPGALATQVRAYWAAVLDPAIPTPSFATLFLTPDGKVADFARADAWFDRNAVTNALGRCDRAWYIILCVEALRILRDLRDEG